MIATESGEFATETILDDPPSVKNHAENQAKQQRGRKEKYLSTIIDYTDSFIYFHVGLSRNDQDMCSWYSNGSAHVNLLQMMDSM